MLRDELRGAAKILRRVHGEPDAVVPVCMQPPLSRELRKRRLFVVAFFGEERQRVCTEDVDAGVDPVLQ
jgi:hypothetical protein